MSRVPIRTKESDILATIMDGLAAKRIWRKRMNSGAMKGAHKGKRWFVRFGEPGMADILATFPLRDYGGTEVLWIEVKNEIGKTSPDQDAFRKEVEEAGHSYFVARSWDEVETHLREEYGW